MATVQSLTARVAVEVILFVTTGIGTYLVVLNTSYFESKQQNGFFCDDTSIRYPKRDESIPNYLLCKILAAVSIPIISVVETLFNIINQKRDRSKQSIAPIPWLLADLYRIFGCLLLGGLFGQFIVETTKVEVGRLRPHFIAVCEPELRKETCHDENGHPRFVTIPTDISSLRTFCQGHVGRDGHRADEGKAIRDARKSFYSGHAQMCFYTATFLIVYLHVRLAPANLGKGLGTIHPSACPNTFVRVAFKSLQIIRPFVQFGILLLAIYISLTRITDYYHHPSDVLTGAVIGTLMAFAMLLFYLQILDRPFVMADVGKARLATLSNSVDGGGNRKQK